VRRLETATRVTYDPDLYRHRTALLEHAASADAIVVRNRTRIDRRLIAAAQRLQVVGRLGVGLDNIDMEACSEAGVVVIPATGANSVSVAEYVMGAMLTLTRGVFDMTAEVAAGRWPRRPRAFGHELMGQTLGLVGLGAIARQVATRAEAFGMRIIAFDPYVPEPDPIWSTVGRRSFPDLLAEADVVSIHTPLTDETRHLFDRNAFERMKQSAILINTARGGVVDEHALVAALRRRQIGAAAIDVFPSEPLEPDQAAKFADLDNLMLTPHVAGNTAESVDRVASLIVDGVCRQLQE
jgi:(S)-sulfolactate dehydrogenase